MVFKAYDIRGIYGKDLTEELVYKIGRAYVKFLNAKDVVVGHDCRLSSPALFEALADGITDQGANVIDIELCTTDMLYFAVAKYKYSGGIMITASHNPKEYNGLKLTRENAIPIGEDSGLMEIKKIVEGVVFDGCKKGEIVKKDVKDDFLAHVLNFVDLKKIKPLKVVVDGGNGMAGVVIEDLFNLLPCKLIPLNLMPDGTYPNHEPNPLLEQNRKEIIDKVKKEKADIGLAFDGDCDRCFFIDDKGKFVSGDFVLALFAERFLKAKKGKILYDVRSSWAVKDIVSKYGGVAEKYKVGHAFMKKKMREENALLGGEVSGHYYFKDNFNCDSGIIAALLMLEIVSVNGKLSKLVEEFKDYYVSGEINSVVEEKDKVITKLAGVYQDGKISTIDGVSVEYDDWHFNVRKSNTEPLLRLNLEAKSKSLMEKKVKEVLKWISGF